MAGHTDNSVEIAAPRDFVFKVTNDLHRWREMFTEYETVDILEERPGYFRFRLATKPDEEGQSWSWISERRLFPEEWRIDARRLEPDRPFSQMRIQWFYDEARAGTRMRWVQDFLVHPEAGFTDKDAEDHINSGSHQEMGAIKDYVERRWKEEGA